MNTSGGKKQHESSTISSEAFIFPLFFLFFHQLYSPDLLVSQAEMPDACPIGCDQPLSPLFLPILWRVISGIGGIKYNLTCCFTALLGRFGSKWVGRTSNAQSCP